MRGMRLSTVLITLNVCLLLLAVAGVAFAAVRLLSQLAEEQALARVEHSGVSARKAVHRSGEEVRASAQVLASRPTLARLLDAPDRSSTLPDYLARFQLASEHDGSAVLQNGRPLASSGVPVDWTALRRAHPHPAGYFLAQTPQGLVLGAWAELTEPEAVVGVMNRVDEAFAAEIAAEIGLPTRILPLAPHAGEPSAALSARALASGKPVSGHLDAVGSYASLVPLNAPNGPPVAIIETVLSGAEISQSLQQLIRSLLGLALVVAGAAAVSSLVLGSRLSRPLQQMTAAAARIGDGDLLTPVLARGGTEMAALAEALEDMRRSLLRLTADLRRQQAESEAIVTGIAEGVFAVDRDRRIQYLNPQAAAWLGTSPESAVGQFCGDVLRPQGEGGERPCEAHCPILHARFQKGARAAEHLQLPDGRRRTVIITSAPPVNDPAMEGDGSLRQIQVMRDETELESARRARDTVLATISHEFKTPLSAQLASIELLLDELPSLERDQIGELVLSLQRGTLRLTQLIDNLLESVRIEAGQFGLRRRTLSADEVVEAALELTRPLLEQRRQEVVVDLPYPFPPLFGDAARLTQVLVNLLANANKFAPQESTIRVGGSVEGDEVSLWVEDQGPGLPVPLDRALCAPFVRSTLAEAEPEAKGVGLGLWIVKSIVERHGGRLEARSRPGATRIGVILPVGGADEDPGRR
ncbi:MAG: HAMP domain-containing protein [Armatimonadetes bacterium]|nr:HAMP domain-containing protein [Armatimonadota bacterium]